MFAVSNAKFDQRRKSILFYLNDVFMKKNLNEHCSYVIEQKKHYLIVVRDDFFEWTKTRVLFKAKAWRMIKFFEKDVICKHDCFEKLTVNDDFENKKIFKKLIKRYQIKKMITSNYHSQINEMIKKNHKIFVWRFVQDVWWKIKKLNK